MESPHLESFFLTLFPTGVCVCVFFTPLTDIANYGVFALKTCYLVFDFSYNGVTEFLAKKEFKIFWGTPFSDPLKI